MSRVVIGVDPHKASNTLVVVDREEQVLAQQRFANDRVGYREMKKFSRGWGDHVWAVEGARGVGACLAQRLVAEHEEVLNVPAKLSARVRALGGGSGRKTDSADAYAVARRGNVAPNRLASSFSTPGLLAIACLPSLAAVAVSFLTPWLALGILAGELLVALVQGWELEEEPDRGTALDS